MDEESRVIKRYKKYIDDDFDSVILRIRRGEIKCGKYANSIKRKNIKIGKVLFDDEGNQGK